MIFKETAPQVLDGTKRQTRRPVKPGEWAVDATGLFIPLEDTITPIHTVYDHNGRLKWQVGRDYAVQVGRGKKAIGRTPLLEAIRRERLQEISMEDAFAEGVHSSEGAWAVNAFEEVWECIYCKAAYRYQGFRWRDNPSVWVLEFERVGEAGEEGE